MLSRDAERLYWMSRYLERAEDTARLVSSYSHLVLDIPAGSEPGWDVLIKVVDAEPTFSALYKKVSERNVVRFLLADGRNLSSIQHSIGAARENVRTTRDMLPQKIWELMNDLRMLADEVGPNAVARRNRFQFLEDVISRNQRINGVIQTTVTRDHSFNFLRLGRLLERCDMTSRIIDVGTAAISGRGDLPSQDLPILWSNLLESLSARAAYRTGIGPLVSREQVIDFLLNAHRFPRSAIYCVNGIEETFSFLNAPSGLFRDVRAIAKQVAALDTSEIAAGELHGFIDAFQVRLGDLHEAITETWFPVVST